MLKNNTSSTNQITLDAEHMEEVRALTYLCSTTGKQEGSDSDVRTRVGKPKHIIPTIEDHLQLETTVTQQRSHNFQYQH